MEQFNQGFEKQSVWKKIQKTSEAAALVALVSVLGVETASAEGQSVEKNADSVKHIAAVLKEKGQAGTIGETPVRRWTTPDHSMVVVGYSSSGGVEFLIQESPDGTMRLFDNGGNGSVDRVILNKAEGGGMTKTATNDLNTFSSMESIAQGARTEASLDPEHVKVYEPLTVGEEKVVRVVDFNTGESYQMIGQEAASLAATMQDKYSRVVGGIEKDLGGN